MKHSWLGRVITVGVIGGLGGTLLAGCENNAQPKEVPVSQQTAHPSLSPEQASKVITAVNQALKQADEKQDVKLAADRLAGPAAQMRQAEYVLHSKDAKSLPTVFSDHSQVVAVTSAAKWPRAIFNVTEPEKPNAPVYVQVIKQPTNQDGFQLWQWMQVLPGKTFPSTNAALKGSPTIAADQKQGLLVSPLQASQAWAATALTPTAKTPAKVDADPLAKTLQTEQQKLQSSLKDLGKLTSTVTLEDKAPLAVQLPDGGALVAATYRYQVSLKDVKDTAPVQFSGELASLLGNNGKVRNQADWEYLLTVLLEVPPAGVKTPASNSTAKETAKKSDSSEKTDSKMITAVAGSRVLVKATGK